jgi:foldase protein PrsA
LLIGRLIAKPRPSWRPLSEISAAGKVLDTRLQTIAIAGDVRISSASMDFEVEFSRLGVYDDLSQLGEGDASKLSLALKEQVLRQLIERKLLIQMIGRDKYFDKSAPELYTECTEEAANIIKSSEFIKTNSLFQTLLRERLCENSLIESYIGARLTKDLKVSPKEVSQELIKRRNNEALDPRVSIKQILLATEEDAKRVKLSLNSANFSNEAREKSIAPEGKYGGSLYDLKRSDLAPIFDVAFSMQPGQISDIIKTPYGFHIVQLIKKGKSSAYDSKEAEERIARYLLNEKRAEERKKWVLLALRTYDVRWASSSSPF